MTPAEWLCGLAVGLGIAVCLAGIWQDQRDSARARERLRRMRSVKPETVSIGGFDAYLYPDETAVEPDAVTVLP